MSSNLILALQITLIGMGLVFAAIILLWWMMTLLTRFTADASSSLNPSASHTGTLSDSPEPASVRETESLAQAAAVGVALAMAKQQLSSAHPSKDPPTAATSAWQLSMRARQMNEKSRRHR